MSKEIDNLIKEMEDNLKLFANKDFRNENSFLLNKYSETEILQIFKFCLLQPSGKSWHPVYQVLLLLFQAAFSESYLIKKNMFIQVGNYKIRKISQKSSPIIYSFGIGSDISFDKSVKNLFNVPIYMYDPTPNVAKFMKNFEKDKQLIFKNEGLYIKEKKLKLYKSSNKKKLNASIYPIHEDKRNFSLVQFRTLESFMKLNNHDRIDILKMDIEGAAVDVLDHMIHETKIRPKQIITEIEIVSINEPLSYLTKITKLMKSIKTNGYEIYNQKLTRKATIELIFINSSLNKNENLNQYKFQYLMYNAKVLSKRIANKIKSFLRKY